MGEEEKNVTPNSEDIKGYITIVKKDGSSTGLSKKVGLYRRIEKGIIKESERKIKRKNNTQRDIRNRGTNSSMHFPNLPANFSTLDDTKKVPYYTISSVNREAREPSCDGNDLPTPSLPALPTLTVLNCLGNGGGLGSLSVDSLSLSTGSSCIRGGGGAIELPICGGI